MARPVRAGEDSRIAQVPPMSSPMPSRARWPLLAALALVALLLAWAASRLRTTAVPGYAVVAGPLVQNVVATGRVAALSQVRVAAEIAGLVIERRVMEGDRVAPGDVLLVLRASDLEARRDEALAALAALREAELPEARARQRQAREALAQAERELARRRELLAQQLVGRESVEQANQAVVTARATAEQAGLAVAALAGGPREAQARERLKAAEALLERAQVRATVAGTVLVRAVEPGDTVAPGQVLLEIAADAPGEILLPLDEKNLGLLRTGQTATCIADAWPDRPFQASVHHIAPRIDPARGTVDVRLRIDPGTDFLRPGMTVTVTLLTGERASALAVPNDALLGGDPGTGSATVLRVRDGRVQRVRVQPGLRGLAMTEVAGDLHAGDLVVAAGALDAADLPADGTRIHVRGQPVPETGGDRRGELPVKLD